MKYALITGCSDGSLGAAMAVRFAKEGYMVFATLRDTRKAASLEKLENVVVLSLDVTDATSIARCMSEVREHLDSGELHLLVNNAGMGAMGPLIDADIETAKRLYDVNVFGLLAMTKACALLLITAKGTVVNISSVGGLLHLPFGGLYQSSKAAVTLLSEVLRLELAPLGVNVVTAMCGHIESNFHTNDAWKGLPPSSYYKPIEDYVAKAADGKVGPAPQSQEVFIENLVSDILHGASGRIYRGAHSQVVRFLTCFVPDRLLDWMMLPITGLNKLATLLKKGA